MPSHLPLAPEIEHLRTQFEQIAAAGDALVAPLSDAQFLWSPAPGAWSVADCLDHLNATARAYLPALDDGIADAIQRGLYGQGPFRYSLLGRLFVRHNEPPVRIRFKTPGAFLPMQNGRSRAQIIAAFRAYQVQFIDRLRQANGLHLARARVRSPVSAWLRIQLGCGFAVMAAHERRHLWQARRLTEMDAFPEA